MKKNILVRTNVLVCAVILLGFLVTSFISYHSNLGIFLKDVESVSTLASEGIYYQIDSQFTRPLNVSLTMANDSLLKRFLLDEDAHLEDAGFIQVLQSYLAAYREKYSFDSVFLASAHTGRYYHFNGLDRVLVPGDPENDWYYAFLDSDVEYALNIDNDQAAGDEITVFINCRILGDGGETLGVVGVGFLVTDLQALLRSYEEQFGVKACMVDGSGMLEVSTEETGYQKRDLFDGCPYPELRETILASRDERQTHWYSSGYVVSQYIPSLDWHLIVNTDTTSLGQKLNLQLFLGIFIIAAIVAFVLFIITGVIQKFNREIVHLTLAQEKRHQNVFQTATEQLYETINELDITHDRLVGEESAHYFEGLGVPPGTPYSRTLEIVAQNQIKEEFRQGYLDAFAPAHVLRAFAEGTDTLQYDFMISGMMSGDGEGEDYHWMRITAKIFRWEEDGSIRMLSYRQDIDEERRRERYLFEQMQTDSLTGLYNKAATQEHIRDVLLKAPGGAFAFFILDIDNFKGVNDRLGHAMGDIVLTEFSRAIRAQFREGDVVGRIGGDEFVAFFPSAGRESVEARARALSAALDHDATWNGLTCRVSASIGVALSPADGADFESLYRAADAALYQTKFHGKNGYALSPESSP